MPTFKNEVARAIYTMLEALTVLGDRGQRTEPIGRRAAEFNDLLARARSSFQNPEVVLGIAPLAETDPFLALITRLIGLKARVDLELTAAPSHEYWRHTCGEYWALQFRQGELWAACGPIAREDIVADLLPHLPYDRRLAHWVTMNRPNLARVHLG
jgi:hypothetical protein